MLTGVTVPWPSVNPPSVWRFRVNSNSMHAAPGTASTAKAGQSRPVMAMTAATRSGPANAPTWSSALCTANPRPRPTATATRASSADFDGLRMALPARSRRMRVAARASPRLPTKGVTASRGTQTAVIAYPRMVSDQ